MPGEDKNKDLFCLKGYHKTILKSTQDCGMLQYDVKSKQKYAAVSTSTHELGTDEVAWAVCCRGMGVSKQVGIERVTAAGLSLFLCCGLLL